MAEPTGLNMLAKILGQIYNLHELIRIGGDVYKLDKKDGKYRNKAGKAWTRPQLVDYVKGQQYKAPKVTDPKKVERNKSLKTKITDKAKSVTRNIKNTKPQFNKDVINRPLENLKLKIGKPNQINLNPNSTQATNPTVQRALQINKYLKGLTPKTIAGGAVKGGANFGAGMFADWASQALLDRGMRNVEGKQKMHINDYRALKDKRFNDLQSRSTWWGGVKKNPNMETNQQIQPSVTRNRRGRVTGTEQPVGRNWQNPEMGPPQSEIETTPPNLGTDNSEKTKEAKNNKSTVGKVMGDYAGSYNETKKKKKKKKNNTLMINGKKPSAIQKKLLKAGFTTKQLGDLVDAYDEKYRNKRGW